MDTVPVFDYLLLISNTAEAGINILWLLLTIFLVFLNGFFVAAEFAIVKIRSSQIEVEENLNKRIAKTSKNIINNLDAYLAATQLGITLASLGLGAIGEKALTPLIIGFFKLLNLTDPYWLNVAEKISFPLAFIIITILHIVFGELAPKSLAIRHPRKTTFAVSFPLRIFYLLFRPFIFVLNGFANFILKLFGFQPVLDGDIHTEEELKVIISESHEGGAIEDTERTLIQNVFDFDDRRVSSILTLRKNIEAVEINSTVKEAIEFAIDKGYSRYPVYEETLGNIKGVLYTKDLIQHVLNNPEDKEIAPLIREATYISESAKIKNVLKEFQNSHVQMGIVTDEIGELTGIVTMEDILEELVGEIQDEYDNEQPIVEQTGEKTYIVNSHYALSDINKYIPYHLEEGEHYETLSGLITEITEDADLEEGDIIEIEGYEVVILKMFRNSAEMVQLTLKEDLKEQEKDL